MADTSDKRRGLPSRVKMRHDQHFVDELTTRSDETVGLVVPLDTIEPDPNQPRSAMGQLDGLASSIREKGVLEPILVRVTGSLEPGDPKYRIVSGERRFRAATQAGLTDIPVIVLDVDEDEALEIALIENLQRKDLTPFEEAEGYRALANKHSYTHQEIASAVGRSRTVITETFKLLEMPLEVRQAAESLEISSRSLLLQITRAAGGDVQAMLGMLEQAAQGQLTREDVRQESREQRPRTEARRKPFTFKFRAPDKAFNLSLSFKRSEVERSDLISALESILTDLRTADVQDFGPSGAVGAEEE